MYASYAEEIINALANGINPITGEILPSDNVCNEPDVIRALYTAAELLKKQAEKEQRTKPANAGKRWTAEEDGLLAEMFDGKYTKKEICEHFGRTKYSVATRLVRLGKIQSTDEFRYKMK